MERPPKAAIGHSVLPLLVLTNFENRQFSTELVTAIFTSEALLDRILNQALQILAEKGYRGLDFDFEYLGAENRERYVRFLQKTQQIVKAHDYKNVKGFVFFSGKEVLVKMDSIFRE